MFKVTPYQAPEATMFFLRRIGYIKFKVKAENDRYAGCYKFFDSQQENIMINVGDYITVKCDS